MDIIFKIIDIVGDLGSKAHLPFLKLMVEKTKTKEYYLTEDKLVEIIAPLKIESKVYM